MTRNHIIRQLHEKVMIYSMPPMKFMTMSAFNTKLQMTIMYYTKKKMTTM